MQKQIPSEGLVMSNLGVGGRGVLSSGVEKDEVGDKGTWKDLG